ncbi:MAG: hypothetical protein KAU06_07035 [Candidatus Marinimicrobia bacterium]|nr:hypothetical protein [Candidatus Neomarinimicrobiota bacterium]
MNYNQFSKRTDTLGQQFSFCVISAAGSSCSAGLTPPINRSTGWCMNCTI